LAPAFIDAPGMHDQQTATEASAALLWVHVCAQLLPSMLAFHDALIHQS
jgi:hypothetical protein